MDPNASAPDVRRRPSRLPYILALLFMGAVVVAAWVGRDSYRPVIAGEVAPVFTATTLDGTPVSLDEYRGKVVLLNVWATWCPPCRTELPSMQRTFKALQDKGFMILGVNVGEKWDTVAPFLEDFSLTYPILLDKDSSAMAEWGIMGLPTTFIVDRQGRVTHRIVGGRDWDDPAFRARLTAIIDQQTEE